MVTASDKRFNRCTPLGIHLNSYRVHLLYFILTILLASIILWSSTANVANSDFSFHLRFIDALFLCTSAMTNSGLNTVNLSSLTSFQQTVIGILMFLGNILTVASFTVWHRRQYCRQHMKTFLAKNEVARGLVEKIAREKREKTTRRYPGLLPTPAQRRFFVHSTVVLTLWLPPPTTLE